MSRQLFIQVIMGTSAALCGVGLLGTMYSWPERTLTVIVLSILFCCSASFFSILKIMRYCLRCREKCRVCKLLTNILCFSSFWSDRLRIFRKSHRYPTNITVKCYDRKRKVSYDGIVQNVSRQGCMISLPKFSSATDIMDLSITLVSANGEPEILRLVASHCWFTTVDDSNHHGCQFDGMEERLAIVWDEVLAQAKIFEQYDTTDQGRYFHSSLISDR